MTGKIPLALRIGVKSLKMERLVLLKVCAVKSSSIT
jgi:hypothetical protein